MTDELPLPVTSSGFEFDLPVQDLPRGVQPAGRITVVESIYFQSPPDQPSDCRSGFVRLLAADDPPYARKMIVGEGWADLDLGHLRGKVGMLSVKNLEVRDRSKTLWVSLDGATFAVVRAGESCRLEPLNPDNMRIKSVSGECRALVTAFPR